MKIHLSTECICLSEHVNVSSTIKTCSLLSLPLVCNCSLSHRESAAVCVCSFVSEWLSFSVQLFCSIFNPHQCLPALSSYPQQQVNGFWRAIDRAVCESSSHAAWQHWAPGIVKLSRKPLSAEGPCFHSLCSIFLSLCVGAVLVAYFA